MARKDEPSYTDLVYEVVRSVGRPLKFQEILDEVNRRRPITTRDPKSTIRNALSQGRLLASLGDGRYGWLPRLVAGSLLRVPLTEKKPADHPLSYPPEVRDALWPDFFEIGKRRILEPMRARLPNGREVTLSLDIAGPYVAGSSMPQALRDYLVENRASAGDSLLTRVIDLEKRQCEMSFEPRRKRDNAAVADRNRELADAAFEVLHRSRSRDAIIWDLDAALLARGVYRSNVAPDPLSDVLSSDSRFVDAGLQIWMLAEAVTPEEEARIRDRKRFERETLEAKEEAPPSFTAQGARRAMERAFADIGAILQEHHFDSIAEANAFLQDLLARGGLPARKAETVLEQAQDIMYDAWEATSPQERIRLARKALQVSLDCADAYVLLAEETARTPKDAVDLYAKGVAAGERALGKKTFEEDAGYFWGLVETRPYMRARLGLAQALWAMGKRDEAIRHAWEMLRLNPGDNQGVRYVLLNWLLELGDDAQAKKLLDLYPDDAAAVWLYGRALHVFRTEGDSKRAREVREEATQENPFVPAYLLGRKKLPSSLPGLIGLGDESEAIYCAVEQMAAWRKVPGALAWLDEKTG